MKTGARAAWVAVFLAAAPAAAQEQKAIDAAVEKGIAWLKTAGAPKKVDDPTMGSEELILWTFVHAGVPETDPRFQQFLAYLLKAPLERTYKVVLQAMILEEIDRVKYQGRIAQCAQFLVDNQCQNGQWSYGTPSPASAQTPTTSGSKDVTTGGIKEYGTGGRREKPKVTQKLYVRPKRTGPAAGDNSNSQYAALGLRACHDAGVVVPKAVIALAKRWWMVGQHREDEKGERSVATGAVSGRPRGWCYEKDGENHRPAYGSMTAGAVGSLAIYDHILGVDWKTDASLRDGLAWLGTKFSVTENVGPCQHGGKPQTFYYYYMYALERAGMLLDVRDIGGHDWYREGARVLLAAQRPDGAWNVADKYMHHLPAWDTCFAILFLKRATRPLVASVDEHKR